MYHHVSLLTSNRAIWRHTPFSDTAIFGSMGMSMIHHQNMGASPFHSEEVCPNMDDLTQWLNYHGTHGTHNILMNPLLIVGRILCSVIPSASPYVSSGGAPRRFAPRPLGAAAFAQAGAVGVGCTKAIGSIGCGVFHGFPTAVTVG